MRAPLPQHDPPDGRLAHQARLPMPVIDAMQTGEAAGLAAWVPEVRDGAPPMTNPGSQDGTDTESERPDFSRPKRRGPSRGTDAGTEKRFVRVDVSDAGNFPLIQEKRLDADSRAGA
jgi:hypothetical protein